MPPFTIALALASVNSFSIPQAARDLRQWGHDSLYSARTSKARATRLARTGAPCYKETYFGQAGPNLNAVLRPQGPLKQGRLNAIEPREVEV